MTCHDCRRLLSAYVDSALDADEQMQVKTHTAQCHGCRAQLETVQALKHALARMAAREDVPDAVFRRINDARAQALGRWKRRRRRLTLTTVASALAIFVVLIVSQTSTKAIRALDEELVADHLRYAPETGLPRTNTVRVAALLELFSDRMPFEPVIPHIRGADLIDGRICRIHGRKTQLLFYAVGPETVSLYISDRPLVRPQCRMVGAQRICGHRVGDLSLTLVGDRHNVDVPGLAKRIAFYSSPIRAHQSP